MVQLRMRTTMAGPERTVRAGKVAEFSDEEAERLVAGGFAEYVGAPPVRKAPASGKGDKAKDGAGDKAKE